MKIEIHHFYHHDKSTARLFTTYCLRLERNLCMKLRDIQNQLAQGVAGLREKIDTERAEIRARFDALSGQVRDLQQQIENGETSVDFGPIFSELESLKEEVGGLSDEGGATADPTADPVEEPPVEGAEQPQPEPEQPADPPADPANENQTGEPQPA